MTDIQKFTNRFRFNPERAFHIGIERECFITDGDGMIVPDAPRALTYIQERGWEPPSHEQGNHFDLNQVIGYELSACQIETRTRPLPIEEIAAELSWQDRELSRSLASLGLSTLHTEVAPESMPLDVYPDPTGRYATIIKTMPREVLLAACRVIGTHVHVGMPNHETALRVYNRVIGECNALCELGDSSSGERLAIYKIVAPDAAPKPFATWQTFFEIALEREFAEDPRKCWTLIRISAHGTIEFRMFGATASLERIMSWAKRCHELCLEASRC